MCAPGVTVGSLRRFRATLIGPTQRLPKRRRLCLPASLKSLRVRCRRYCASDYKCEVVEIWRGIGWLAASDIPSHL